MITLSIIAIILLVLELVYFRLADHFNIIDKPNMRSSHSRVTLRGGGIIFLLGMWAYTAFYGFSYPWFLLGVTLVSLVSFVDDIREIPNRIRLLVQFASVFLMFYQLGILQADLWWLIILALIVCVGTINAYNFMDGINGITGGYSLAVIIPLIYVNSQMHFIDAYFLYVAAISLLVFCLFNFKAKAKCFAGDVGSICIAFVVMFALAKLMIQTHDFTYILFLGVYGIDTVFTIIHRLKLRENIGKAHRKHTYQLLCNELKLPHTLVASLYMGLQLIISFALILLPLNNWLICGVSLCILAFAYLVIRKKYYHLHEKYLNSQPQ